MNLKGVITALVTPFIGQQLDEAGLIKNIHHQISHSVDGLLLLGTTGETPTLSVEEQTHIIRIAVSEAKGKVPILIGTGSYCTRKTVEMTIKAKELGADGAVIVAPYYNKPTQEGIFRHYEEVASNVDLPVIVYNIQGRCGVNIETATLMRIAQLPHIVGVKEASGNINQAGDVLYAAAKKYPHFKMFSGDDSFALPMIALGAVGVISVVSNLVPAKVVELVHTALKYDFKRAQEMHHQLLPLMKAAFFETNPMPIKAAMQACGMPSGECRLPLCQMRPENLTALRSVLQEMQLIEQ